VNAQGGFFRNNAFLAAAVALPVLVVGFFLLATAIPRWTVPPPTYDLVFRVGKPYDQPRPQVSVEFKVEDGRLQAIVLDLVPHFLENGWRTADKKPVKNEELWRRLDEARRIHDIDWRWVKGHAGHAENERADELARLAMAEFKPRRETAEPQAD
jgi:hypothetical protein